ncbi:helix-turn-helix transcriptional regulator [Ornithinimicrobium pekingense]|uniref:Helix-turn-helix transcriptional regulator n=1 Tax=Ornithinimicrobium pekingense TaxID=384677 RepID=A0ABQ2FF60_9MICO|nr:helix-turn-helix transcriptional regulator [Ornithinimicrobium pekingense]GGK79691.1 helix-turn-helix transcriptional regulator [Ornithinimicrobium pekingense]
MTAVGQRLGPVIHDAAVRAPDGHAFRRRVLELLGDQVPFDAACLATTEPHSMLPTSLTTVGYQGTDVYAAVLDIEYGVQPEPGRFVTMRDRPVPVQTHREATGDRPRSSRFYADVLAPQGLEHEVRMIFRGSDRLAWGACTLARSGPEFTDDESAALAAVLTDVADGLRGTLFRDAAPAVPAGAGGPAVVVVGRDGTIETWSDAARDYLERLGWGPAGVPESAVPAVVLAGWLRRSGRLSDAWRVRTLDGRWVLVRGGLLPDGGTGRVVLTFEPASVSALAPLLATAYHLTRREREVLGHLLADRTREEIARALFLSPYTVQDHLKSIYAKTGTTGRRGLVSLVVREECFPRLGGGLGMDGWFAGPSGRTSPGRTDQ